MLGAGWDHNLVLPDVINAARPAGIGSTSYTPEQPFLSGRLLLALMLTTMGAIPGPGWPPVAAAAPDQEMPPDTDAGEKCAQCACIGAPHRCMICSHYICGSCRVTVLLWQLCGRCEAGVLGVGPTCWSLPNQGRGQTSIVRVFRWTHATATAPCAAHHVATCRMAADAPGLGQFWNGWGGFVVDEVWHDTRRIQIQDRLPPLVDVIVGDK